MSKGAHVDGTPEKPDHRKLSKNKIVDCMSTRDKKIEHE